jgi:hypothetical protein
LAGLLAGLLTGCIAFILLSVSVCLSLLSLFFLALLLTHQTTCDALIVCRLNAFPSINYCPLCCSSVAFTSPLSPKHILKPYDQQSQRIWPCNNTTSGETDPSRPSEKRVKRPRHLLHCTLLRSSEKPPNQKTPLFQTLLSIITTSRRFIPLNHPYRSCLPSQQPSGCSSTRLPPLKPFFLHLACMHTPR